uniref:Serpin domain-containing protein n=1 Tax=Oryza rufipogon TaxID=4529 RepID=A0A0E0R629_ORYRU
MATPPAAGAPRRRWCAIQGLVVLFLVYVLAVLVLAGGELFHDDQLQPRFPSSPGIGSSSSSSSARILLSPRSMIRRLGEIARRSGSRRWWTGGVRPESGSPRSEGGNSSATDQACSRRCAASGLAGMALRLAERLSLEEDSVGGGNLVFSLLSIYSALTVVTAGARGTTLAELLAALGAPSSRDALAEDAGEIVRALPGGSGTATGGPRVAHACGLWHDRRRNVKPAFRDAAAASFQATTRAVDFLANPEEARNEINSWVAAATENLIDTILPPGSVSTDTRLVVASAIYFNATWQTPFRKQDTKKDKFHILGGGGDVDADFMRSGDDQYVAAYDGFKVLKMPYNTRASRTHTQPQYSLCVFLPDKRNGLWTLADRMEAGGGEVFLREHMPEKRVKVGEFRIPRFKLSFDGSIKTALQGVGVRAVFDPAAADLSDVLEEGNSGDPPLFVSDVLHGAAIEVNEEGTEVAAATVVIMKGRARRPSPAPAPVDFVADHPFAFFVVEESSGAVLFAGHVVDPTNPSQLRAAGFTPIYIFVDGYLYPKRNALFFYSDARRKSLVAANTSAFAARSSRCLHSMGSLGSPAGRRARRFHDLRDVVSEHADAATATLSVVVFSAVAGILHLMQDTDEARKEDTPTKTNPYFRSNQLMEDLIRERASYNETTPDEKTVVREYMEDDQAMRARFKDWMKEHGRTYKQDEVEEARRFKIFKSVARFSDAANDDSANAGHSTRFGLNEFSDWNQEELARMCCCMPARSDGGGSGIRRRTPFSTMESCARRCAVSGLMALSMRLTKQLSAAAAASKAGAAGNLVFSPLSIYSALSVVTAGARGRTLTELLGALGAESREKLAANAGEMARALPAPGGGAAQPGGGPRVAHACGVWHERTRTVRPAFRDAAAASFNAAALAVDFLNNPEEARKEINSWVAAATENLIDTILPPGSVSTDTGLVVTSAIYFNGQWRTPFCKEITEKRAFHRLDGGDVEADFMRSGEDQYIAVHDGFKVLKMPYAACVSARTTTTPRYSMYVFLPDERDGLWSLEDRMAAGGGEGFLREHTPERRVEVGEFRIPRFKLSFDDSVVGALQRLGVRDVFKPFVADLADVLEAENSGDDPPLFVSDVKHKAVIEVNEEGTEAAAATAVCLTFASAAPSSRRPARVDFVADHPFAFLVVEESSGAVLFAGHVVDPTDE